FRETYWITLDAQAAAPCLGQVLVAFFLDDDSQAHVPLRTAQGELLGSRAILGRFKIAGPQAAAGEPPATALGRVGQAFALTEFTVDRTRTLTWPPLEMGFTWQALGPGGRDYTVFVHLLDEQGDWVAGADAPPREGQYPTGLWEAGEIITDTRTLSLEGVTPGRYRLVAGLYDPETLERLPSQDAAGRPLENGALPLTELEVLEVRTRLYLPAFREWGEPEPAPTRRPNRAAQQKRK
ncbi:MAG: hypothetical protein GX605_08180, partial [Chloroflexi bacterium]|nr:hypothetical protein [Chloroflexota bacterium]